MLVGKLKIFYCGDFLVGNKRAESYLKSGDSSCIALTETWLEKFHGGVIMLTEPPHLQRG